MGVNNRARRAAKKRKRVGRGSAPGRPSADGGFPGDYFPDEGFPGEGFPGDASCFSDGGFADAAQQDQELASALLHEAIEDCRGPGGADKVDHVMARRIAAALVGAHSPVGREVMAGTAHQALASYLAGILRAGWGPSDLAEIIRRRLSAEHLPLLAQLLAAHAKSHPVHLVAPQWRAELDGLTQALGGGADGAGLTQAAVDLRVAGPLAQALGLMTLLGTLPAVQRLIPPPGVAPEAGSAALRADGPAAPDAVDAKVLGKVRAMLAKAESTEFPEEAEAFSAKAQELISRYALERLVAAAGAGPSRQGPPVVARRIWLESPYVLPKAMLVDAVARANRCSAVVAEQLGFSTVVGSPADLDAVELLSTSLLVQASAAMLRGEPRRTGGYSRTTSFRRSFLISYAHRVGERLTEADVAASEASGHRGELVPLLRRHGERVNAVVEEMFPHVVSKATSISNMEGWAQGRAAADRAQLDTRQQVPPDPARRVVGGA